MGLPRDAGSHPARNAARIPRETVASLTWRRPRFSPFIKRFGGGNSSNAARCVSFCRKAIVMPFQPSDSPHCGSLRSSHSYWSPSTSTIPASLWMLVISIRLACLWPRTRSAKNDVYPEVAYDRRGLPCERQHSVPFDNNPTMTRFSLHSTPTHQKGSLAQRVACRSLWVEAGAVGRRPSKELPLASAVPRRSTTTSTWRRSWAKD